MLRDRSEPEPFGDVAAKGYAVPSPDLTGGYALGKIVYDAIYTRPIVSRFGLLVLHPARKLALGTDVL